MRFLGLKLLLSVVILFNVNELQSAYVPTVYDTIELQQNQTKTNTNIKPKTDESETVIKKLKKLKNKELADYVPQKPKVTLIIAPHPDDEILCCGTEIKAAKERGENIKVIFVTHGDGIESGGDHSKSIAYGETRRLESLGALSDLGIKQDETIWLNFPDRELVNLDTEIITSSYTGQSQTNETGYFPFEDYTETALLNIFGQIFDWYEVEKIYTPHPYQDKHVDHRYVSQLILNVLRSKDLTPEVFTYNIHGKYYGSISRIPDQFKLELIQHFKSQFHDQYHKRFLENFAYREEILPRYYLNW